MYFLEKNNWLIFLHHLINSREVVGPKAKGDFFVFDTINHSHELRLDYDTTLLPPKKFFFQPRQDLITFSPSKIESCIQPIPRILFGVHPYDIKAISMLDKLFREKGEDWNYLANREAATLVGTRVKNVSQHAFFESMGAADVNDGYDLFLTEITTGFLVEVHTDKGKDLLGFGTFHEASHEQIREGHMITSEQPKRCPQHIPYSPEEIAEKVRQSFKSHIWEEMSRPCFSCGSCNIVCPTCYCFDVQDVWNIDQQSGTRFRTWDGCLTEDFARVSVQGGTENFREDRASRYRHRIMRKAAYLNPQLGGPACVGCGRCVSACPAGIANPVRIIGMIMERQNEVRPSP